MLNQLITETLLGALTGYVTNHTAIRSLFQPGGVIEKTRDDFAREAGRLLEDQVLTQAVLAEQLRQPEVQRVLQEALQTFFQTQLPDQLSLVNLNRLPDYAAACQVLQQWMAGFLQQERESLLSLFKKQLHLSELLDAKQCTQLAEQLQKLLIETLQQEQWAVRYWQQWQKELGATSLESLGLGGFCDALVERVAQLSQNWLATFTSQYEQELEALLTQSIQALQLRPVLLELDQQMAQYTMQQYLRCDAQQLASLLEQYCDSAEGQALLNDLLNHLLIALSAVEAPLAQIIPDNIKEQLGPLLQRELPSLLGQLVSWVQQNRQAVYDLLCSAIDEVAMESGGLKRMLLEQLKGSLLDQILQQTDFDAMMQAFLRNEQTEQQTVTLLMEKLQALLTEYSLGQVIQRCNRHGGLMRLLCAALNNGLQQFWKQQGVAFCHQLLDWKPGSLQLARHQTQIEHWIVHLLLQQLSQIPIDQLLLTWKPKLRQCSPNQLLSLSERQLETLLVQAVQQGCSGLAAKLPELRPDQIWQPLYDALERWMALQGTKWLQVQGASYTLNDFLQLIQPFLQQLLPQMEHGLTQKGLQSMEGQLSKLAQQQIGQLSQDAMLQLVEDFMGRELQPLNYLGAGMGAAVGATVGTTLSATLPMHSVAPAMFVGALLGKSVVFGAVGYGTNCAAVKGLFWPYEPVGGIELVQGVIPKQKKRFAHSMGQLVERYVINDQVLRQLLQENEPQWMQQALQLAMEKQWLRQSTSMLVGQRKQLAQIMLRWLIEHGSQSCQQVLHKLGDLPLAFVGHVPRDPQLQAQLTCWLDGQITKLLHQPIPLHAVLSAEQLWSLICAQVKECTLPDCVVWAEHALASDRPLNQLVPDGTVLTLCSAAERGTTQWLAREQNRVRLAAQLSKVLQIEQLQQWLGKNSDTWLGALLTHLFTWAGQVLLQLLHEKQAAITQLVQQAILNRLGLMQQMGYAMMDGDAIVAQIIDRVLHQKLPIFLSVKQKELETLLARFWKQNLFPAFLQLPISAVQLESSLTALLAYPAVIQGIGGITSRLTAAFCRQPVNQWGCWLNSSVLLERVQLQLGFQWQLHHQDVLQVWQAIGQDFCAAHILPVTLQELTGLYHETFPATRILLGQKQEQLLDEFLLRIKENASITMPRQWVDWSRLSVQVEAAMSKLLHDTAFQNWFLYAGEVWSLQLTAQAEQILSPAMQRAILQPALEAAFATAVLFGSPLLTAVRLADLAEERLIQMDNAHLEQVVRGFSSQYLVHIENRGWLGAIFALPGMLLYLL